MVYDMGWMQFRSGTTTCCTTISTLAPLSCRRCWRFSCKRVAHNWWGGVWGRRAQKAVLSLWFFLLENYILKLRYLSMLKILNRIITTEPFVFWMNFWNRNANSSILCAAASPCSVMSSYLYEMCIEALESLCKFSVIKAASKKNQPQEFYFLSHSVFKNNCTYCVNLSAFLTWGLGRMILL